MIWPLEVVRVKVFQKKILRFLLSRLFDHQGLWTERIYHKFHSKGQERVEFPSFMEGMNCFTKSKLETLIANTFTLYDADGSGFIVEEEFISMVLNYPIDLLESSLPYNFVYSTKTGAPASKSTVQNKLFVGANPLRSFASHRSGIDPKRHASLNTQAQLAGTGEITKLAEKKKAAPTTINTRIKDWAVNEFRKHSTLGKMSLADYQVWAKSHHDFFKKFKQFFRTDWWLEYEDATVRHRRLSFSKIQTQIKSSGKYALIKETPEDCRMAIFDNLLMIFKPNNLEMPIRLMILKELDIECFDGERKVHLSHRSPYYPNAMLTFNDEDHYRQWKLLIQTCSKRSIRLSYAITKKLGKGKFSNVYLAKSIKDSRLQYAVKKIDKAKLSEEEKEVLALSYQKRNQHHERFEQ